jgi:HEAT repeat protein
MSRASAAEYRMLQIQICEALVKLGDEGQLPAIRAALYPSRVEDLEIVALAVQILGQLKDKGSVDELIYLTARKSESDKQFWPAEIRLGAAGALARMGLDQGTFLADEYATNAAPVLRAQAAHVYGDIGRIENLGKLEGMMADSDSLVRLSAAAAILQVGPRSPVRASR